MIYDSLARVMVQCDGASVIWQMIRVPAVGESIWLTDGSDREYRVTAVCIAAFRGSRDGGYVDATITVSPL